MQASVPSSLRYTSRASPTLCSPARQVLVVGSALVLHDGEHEHFPADRIDKGARPCKYVVAEIEPARRVAERSVRLEPVRRLIEFPDEIEDVVVGGIRGRGREGEQPFGDRPRFVGDGNEHGKLPRLPQIGRLVGNVEHLAAIRPGRKGIVLGRVQERRTAVGLRGFGADEHIPDIPVALFLAVNEHIAELPRRTLPRLLSDGIAVVHFPFGEVGIGKIFGTAMPTFWLPISPSPEDAQLSLPAVKKSTGLPSASSVAPPDHTPSGATVPASGVMTSLRGVQLTISSETRCPQQMLRKYGPVRLNWKNRWYFPL